MTLEQLKSLIEKANETQHDNNLNCGVCKAAADLSDMSRTALPAALELIEQMAEALGIALRALDAETRHGRTLSGHNAIAAYEAFKLNVGGE